VITFEHHAPLTGFDCDGDELSIAGMSLSALASRIGRTPFYAYSRDVMRARVADLRARLPGNLHLHYAIKANPMPAVVQLMSTLVDGLDVASAGEMRVALDTGSEPDRISFAGPGKTAAEIEQAVAAGIVLTAESAHQVALAIRAGERLGVQPRLAVRVNPSFELKMSGMKMGGGAKPFGMDEERVPEALAAIEAGGARFSGLHIFCGSQSLNADAICDAQRNAFALAQRLLDGRAQRGDWLNIGGGLGVPYFPGERALDVGRVAENLLELSDLSRTQLGLPLVIELGRYLVASAGIYVTRVLERKVSHGEVFLICDGGLHHHLAASGNFGQVIRKNYPVAIGTRMSAGGMRLRQTVVGPLCTPLDILADRMSLPEADAGDLVVVFQSGAYGLTASPRGFLGHPEPAEVLV